MIPTDEQLQVWKETAEKYHDDRKLALIAAVEELKAENERLRRDLDYMHYAKDMKHDD